MFIQTESTPNPATLKFLPGRTVLEVGTADFPSADTAAQSPLAQRIFAVSGVQGVFFGSDFVTVTKTEETLWDHIKPAILGAIMEHFQSGDPVVSGPASEDDGHAAHAPEDDEVGAARGEPGHLGVVEQVGLGDEQSGAGAGGGDRRAVPATG